VASDGTIVIVRTSHPITGQSLNLGIAFFGSNRNAIPNQNYAITITQDNSIVLSKSNAYASSGIDTLTTFRLPSSDPINMQVTLNGIGPSTADPSTWTGVKGEVLTFSQGPQGTTNMTSTTSTTNMTTTTPTTNMTAPASTNATVPEFGSAASIVLATAILSIILFASKTRVIPRI
jgi:predicted secreted protein with PEFG-CTERM motif